MLTLRSRNRTVAGRRTSLPDLSASAPPAALRVLLAGGAGYRNEQAEAERTRPRRQAPTSASALPAVRWGCRDGAAAQRARPTPWAPVARRGSRRHRHHRRAPARLLRSRHVGRRAEQRCGGPAGSPRRRQPPASRQCRWLRSARATCGVETRQDSRARHMYVHRLRVFLAGRGRQVHDHVVRCCVQERQHARGAQGVLLVADDQIQGKFIAGQGRRANCPLPQHRISRDRRVPFVHGENCNERQRAFFGNEQRSMIVPRGQPTRPLVRGECRGRWFRRLKPSCHRSVGADHQPEASEGQAATPPPFDKRGKRASPIRRAESCRPEHAALGCRVP